MSVIGCVLHAPVLLDWAGLYYKAYWCREKDANAKECGLHVIESPVDIKASGENIK